MTDSCDVSTIDAPLRYRVLRHLGPSILAADDDGE